jgi:hypothetical protein
MPKEPAEATRREDSRGVTFELHPEGWPRIRIRLTDKGQLKVGVEASPLAITAAYLQGSEPGEWSGVHFMSPGAPLGANPPRAGKSGARAGT